MSVEVVEPVAGQRWPLRVRANKPAARQATRTIRIGLLGLGQVGQAVARLASDSRVAAHAGVRFQVEQALVRDVTLPRRCQKPARLTTNQSAFLRGNYDVVIEALGNVEPARTIVARLLGRGTAVVTANKALVAEHRESLAAIAASRGAAFRYEATALSAVPFLGTLAARPLVASVNRLVAIVNGTSNFILTSLLDGESSFDAAVASAQRLGYAEPDPSRDLDGLDASDKLLLLTALFGWGRISRDQLEVSGIRQITPADLAAARTIGGVIKPVVSAERDAGGVRAFVGPALLSMTEPLASLGGALNGIRLDGTHVSNLFFSGPGAGPDVTAATLLDDAIEAVSIERQLPTVASPAQPVFPAAPSTGWFVRLTFPGVLPSSAAATQVATSAGLRVDQAIDFSTEHSRWVVTGPQGRRDVDAALARLSERHRIDAVAVRRV